jgi:DamX protein
MNAREMNTMTKNDEFPESFSLTAGDRITGDEFISREQPQPFYEGGQRRYVIDQAIHHLHFDTAAVLILGEEGSGKTILLDQLLNDLQESMDGCLLDVEAIGPAGLLPELAAGLDLHDVVEFTCENVARSAAERSSSLGLPLLVTMDNAESMSLEQIDALFEVARLSHGSLRLLLCGDVSLQSKADRAAQGEAVFALQLPPLSRAEVGEYLQFLARRSGQLGRLALPSEALQKIYVSSHGNIALINQQADELFAAGSGISAFKWRDVTRMPLLHLGLVVGLVVLLLILRFSGNEAAPEQKQASEPVIAIPAGGDSTATVQDQQAPAMVSKELALPDPAQSAVQSAAQAPVQVSAQTLPAPVLPSPQPAAEAPLQAVVAPEVIAPQPAAIEEAAPIAEPVVEKPKAGPASVAKKTTTSSAGGRGEQALLAMRSSSFVLQVFASHEKAKVAKFVKTWQPKVKISYFETRHNGKPWFVAVVAGPYKTSAAARVAVAKLPAGLREQKPWPRQLSSIQQDIRQLN